MPDDEFWRKALEGVSMPSEGVGPPQMESESKEPVNPDGETPVLVQKVVTEIYVITSLDNGKAFFGSQPFQDIQILGEMRLGEAMKLVDSAKKKRRRRRN